jgi:hypothetical protein
MECLAEGKYLELGEMMKTSHDGDRIERISISDQMLDKYEKDNTDVSTVAGDYGCSTEQIDYLCDTLNQTDGVLGSEIVGAGLGGCVVALVENSKANKIIENINEKYYDKYGYERNAYVCLASHGSKVVF